MPCSLPLFETHRDKYRADTCLPLIQGVEAGELQLEALVHGHYPGRKLPRGALHGLKTIGYWNAEHDQPWGLGWHRNEGLELTFLETGELDFAVDGNTHSLHPDHLTITRPWQKHRVGLPNVTAGRLHWVILDVGVRRPDQSWRWPTWLVLTKQDRAELTKLLRHNEHPVWGATPEIRDCFQRIGKAVRTDERGDKASQLTVLLNELFLSVLEMLRQQDISLDESLSDTQRSVHLFLIDLRENVSLQSQEWTVRAMASSCGLGVTRFIHYCSQLANTTPMRYLNECRLDTAAKLLRGEVQLPITQIALRCGFSSSQYFATAFRRRFGITPQTYRESGDETGATDETGTLASQKQRDSSRDRTPRCEPRFRSTAESI